jgi:hypothetical protein
MVTQSNALAPADAHASVGPADDQTLHTVGTFWMLLTAAERLPDTPEEKQRIARAKAELQRRLEATGRTIEDLHAYVDRCVDEPPEPEFVTRRRRLSAVDDPRSA